MTRERTMVISVDEIENLQGHPVDKYQDLQAPNDDMVICPNCVHQFRAIPVNVRAELSESIGRAARLAGWLDEERERREAAESLLRGVVTVWPHLTPITDHFARYKD